VTPLTGPGPELLLDTCVYIDEVQGRAPPELDRLLRMRVLNHSSVAPSELTHLFGRFHPAHPGTRSALKELRGIVDDIPAHRLTAPSLRAAGEAGMLAGLAARLTGRAAAQALLNDSLILLHAAETGCVLLTRNVMDFDVLQQLAPQTQVLLYRIA
jgi:predicted nucleic acid-binding protein